MRVTVSVGGKFWAFHLAQELQRHGVLFRLLTTYFGYNARGMRIDRNRVLTNIAPELWFRVLGNIPILGRRLDGEMRKVRSFDRWASQQIEGSDLIVSWAGFALETFKRARSMGIKTVLEEGSTHRVFQREILEEEYARQGMKRALDRRLEERREEEYGLADFISVPSQFVFRSFVSKGVSPGKLIVTPFGVDLSEFKKIRKEDQKFRVLFVANGSFRKGLHYLLQAVHELKLRNLEVCIIAARIADEMKPAMAQYRGSYRHIGGVPFLDLHRYYSQGSVFVLPSIEEGMALVLLQAMACGLPVICTPNTGGEDVVRNGREGFIVPIRNPGAIREKIQYLYEHEDARKEMADAAFQRVRSEFSWSQYGNRMVKVYNEILGGADRQ